MSEFDKAIDTAMQKGLRAMTESMFMIEADTKQLAPVDTGTLKRSYVSDAFIDGDNIVGVVGTPVEYAVWADIRKPHLTKAVDQNMEQVKRKIKDALSEG